MSVFASYLSLKDAILSLKSGKVIGMPTETVYGLAADIMQEKAVRQIFSLKNRPADHPLIIHIADKAMLNHYAVDIPLYAHALANFFWPGPLTLVLPKSSRVGDWVTGGQSTVGVRMPNHPMALELIEAMDVPLAAPSANQFGRISPTTAAHVIQEFDGRVNTLDGGPCKIGIESTIVLATDANTCTILRPGMISTEKIRAVVGSQITVLEGSPSLNIKVPGNCESHYAPLKPTFLCHSLEEWERLNSIAQDKVYTLYYSNDYDQHLSMQTFKQRLSSDPLLYAQQLYASLRMADHSSAKIIAIEAPRSEIAWAAIGDRLKKATAKSLLVDISENTR